MKVSRRESLEIQWLHDNIQGKIFHFVKQMQLYPYHDL